MLLSHLNIVISRSSLTNHTQCFTENICRENSVMNQNTNNPLTGEKDEVSQPIVNFTDLASKIDKWIYENSEESNKPSTYDIPGLEQKKEEKTSFYSDRSSSSWQDRLGYMWQPDEYGQYSPELQFVREGTLLSFFAGAAWGAWQESAKIHRIFLEQNKYTMFQHPREAQRALQDRIVLAMIQGGWRAGWRMGVLTFTMTSVCQSLTVIRNYINPLDFGAGGAAMGAVYRFNMGPRGMLGAGIGGGVLGLSAGIVVWAAQAISGESVAERWHREFQNMEMKKRAKEDIIANKEKRKELIEEEEMKKQKIIQPEEDTPYTLNREDRYRAFIMKISEWLEYLGVTGRSGADNFRLIKDDEKQDSEGKS